MEFQVTLLITIITTSAVLAGQTDDLETAIRKTETNFDILARILEGDLTSSQLGRLRANAKNIGRKLKYFTTLLDQKEFEAVKQHLDAAEKILSAKDTRGILDSGVELMKGALQSVANVAKDYDLIEKLKKFAAKSAKVGLDMLGAATNVASTAIDAIYPTEDNRPMGVIDSAGYVVNRIPERQVAKQPEMSSIKKWKSPLDF